MNFERPESGPEDGRDSMELRARKAIAEGFPGVLADQLEVVTSEDSGDILFQNLKNADDEPGTLFRVVFDDEGKSDVMKLEP